MDLFEYITDSEGNYSYQFDREDDSDCLAPNFSIYPPGVYDYPIIISNDEQRR